MDPTDLIEKIETINPDLPLKDKLAAIMEIVQESASRMHTFWVTLGKTVLSSDLPSGMPTTDDPRHPHHRLSTQTTALRAAIMDTLAPHASNIVVDLDTAATFILTIGLASLIVKSAFSLDQDATVALTIRALTGKDTQ